MPLRGEGAGDVEARLADARAESESLGREKVALQKAAGEIAPGRPSRTEQQFFHNTARRPPPGPPPRARHDPPP